MAAGWPKDATAIRGASGPHIITRLKDSDQATKQREYVTETKRLSVATADAETSRTARRRLTALRYRLDVLRTEVAAHAEELRLLRADGRVPSNTERQQHRALVAGWQE